MLDYPIGIRWLFSLLFLASSGICIFLLVMWRPGFEVLRYSYWGVYELALALQFIIAPGILVIIALTLITILCRPWKMDEPLH